MGTVRLSSVPGDMVSADRGFDTDEIVGLMHAKVRVPLFTKGYSQVHAQDVDSIREFGWALYSCGEGDLDCVCQVDYTILKEPYRPFWCFSVKVKRSHSWLKW